MWLLRSLVSLGNGCVGRKVLIGYVSVGLVEV